MDTTAAQPLTDTQLMEIRARRRRAETDVDLLLAEVHRLRAQVQAIETLADNMEAENPKPGAGGWLADQLRQTLAQAAEMAW